MKNFNKTLAIAAIAVASTFAAQSAKAQDTFGTDFGTPISVEVQPEADADFSISTFDNEAYVNGGVMDRSFLDTGWKLAKMLMDPDTKEVFNAIKNMCKNGQRITLEDVIAKLKSLGHGILVTTVGIGTITFLITYLNAR